MKTYIGFITLLIATIILGYSYHLTQSTPTGLGFGICAGYLIVTAINWTQGK